MRNKATRQRLFSRFTFPGAGSDQRAECALGGRYQGKARAVGGRGSRGILSRG